MTQSIKAAFLSAETPYGTPVERRVHIDHLWIADCASGWQCGEPGMVDAILSVIGDGERRVCEFGAGDAGVTALMSSSLINRGWEAMLIEGDPAMFSALEAALSKYQHRDRLTILNRVVRHEGDDTIEAILSRNGWDMPDVLVVDIDGAEWYVVKSLGTLPRVLVVEHRDAEDPFNPPLASVPRIEECGTKFCQANRVLQANAPALDELLAGRMVCVAETQFNSIYVSVEDAERLRKPLLRLNVGAGACQIEGYVPVEIKAGTDARRLPYADGSVDEVYASHVLEHVPRRQVVPTLREWARVLKPNGIMRVAVPNLRLLSDRMNDMNEERVEAVIFGGQDDEHDQHYAGHTPESLRRAMNAAGIGYVVPFKAFAADCSRLDISLNLEGRKRAWSTKEKPKVAWVMTQGRLGFSQHTRCMIDVAHSLGFSVVPCDSTFWDRDIEASTKNALDSTQADYFMYTDYDGIFTAADALKMLDRINGDATIGAIVCQQMSRHDDMPLVFDEKIDYSGPMSDVTFGHFGLTFVRREVFEEMPRPWFWSIPGVNADGGIGQEYPNRSDADITFWRSMAECGFRVVQCNDVVIGHLVEAVKFPLDKGSGVQYQPIQHYWRNGRPTTANINQDIYREKKRRRAAMFRPLTNHPETVPIPASPMHAAMERPSGTIPDQHDQG